MISIPEVIVKEASRVYGDMAEKVAFDVNVDPASILGALAGGYVANRVQGNLMAQQQQKSTADAQQRQRIENNYYDQVSGVLSNLKIVFTPINVIYSVNGQVFEIIDSGEMTANMKRAFLQKDAGYFKDILVNKMNMEIQLAEQAFAQRLLAQQGLIKNAAHYVNIHGRLPGILNLSEEEFELAKTAVASELAGVRIPMPINFDTLRPFERADEFFNGRSITKVAGILDYFNRQQEDTLSLKDLEEQVQVGFLPDRVVFLHNGQLLEQLPLLGMNEAGYEAFRRKDKQFFLNFFRDKSSQIAAQIALDVAHDDIDQMQHVASGEESAETIEKAADTLEEVMERQSFSSAVARDNIEWFNDDDIHPLMYDKILSDKYGEDWYENAIEATLKQIELDFHLEHGIGAVPANKIMTIMAMMSETTSMFDTSLSFEKFARSMNGKSVDFAEFQGNVEFEEILLALEIAKAFKGPEVFMGFHTLIPQYVSEEIFQDNVRFVSKQVYDEANMYEGVFWDSVNGYLARKWKEKDAAGTYDTDGIRARNRVTEMIRETGETVLDKYAEQIDLQYPYESTAELLDREGFLTSMQEDLRSGVGNAVVSNVARHLAAGLYLEFKHQELEILSEKEVSANGAK